MASDALPDPASPFGQRVRTRLRDEHLLWFTTVGADGTPQPNPVWFLWDGADSLIMYNLASANRLTHIASRPRVALNLDGNGQGGDIVVLIGRAELAPDAPAAHENEQYLAKYREPMGQVSGTPEAFGAAYPVAVTVRIERVRGH